MKTKEEKKKQLETGKKYFKENKILIFADFTGLTANDINLVRKTIKGEGGIFFVIKKTLLDILLKENQIDFDFTKIKGPMGVAFLPHDLISASKIVYKLAKQFKIKKLFKILGGIEIETKKNLMGNEIELFGQLPGREELIAKLIFMISSPIRKLMFVLNEKAKK